MRRRGFIAAATGVASGGLASGSLTALSQPVSRVDLELILAVDCSMSIDDAEFRLQVEGTASAFTDPAVLRAITGGEAGAIAVAYMQWAGPHEQQLSIPWTRIGSRDAAYRLSDRIRRQPRAFRGDATSIGTAIDYGRRVFASSTFHGQRRTIDISSDGINNAGRVPPSARDDAVAEGITINALPILSEYGGLDVYFRDEVIGGAGAFVLPVPDFSVFAQAIRAKLIRELS